MYLTFKTMVPNGKSIVREYILLTRLHCILDITLSDYTIISQNYIFVLNDHRFCVFH